LCGQHHRRRRRESSVRIVQMSGIVVRMSEAMTTDRCVEGLRLRRCFDPTCNTLFTICAACDRGQRYCQEACRKRMRQLQLRAAGRRYQTSEAGKQRHCQRQQAYRHRRSQAPVTHQGPVPITFSGQAVPAGLSRCAVCGQENRWINPFYWLPRRRRNSRTNRRSAKRPNFYVST
jgi:hypothetical protein